MASILRQLKDEDLESISHMIRRDAHTDLEIAKQAEKLLGKKIARTDGARQKIIARYRNGTAYTKWLKRFLSQYVEMEKSIAETRARYEVIAGAVNGGADGMDAVSNALQARLLVLATEADDDELKSAAGAKGWVATALRLTREVMQDRYRKQVEELKTEIKRMIEKPKGKKVASADVVAKVDEIMGLA